MGLIYTPTTNPNTYSGITSLVVDLEWLETSFDAPNETGLPLMFDIFVESSVNKPNTEGKIEMWSSSGSGSWVEVATHQTFNAPVSSDGEYRSRLAARGVSVFGAVWTDSSDSKVKTRLRLTHSTITPTTTLPAVFSRSLYDLVQIIPLRLPSGEEEEEMEMRIAQSDVNCDGVINENDYFQFFDDWSNGSASADFTIDRVLDFDDVCGFVDAFVGEY